ncbi:MAG: efflux RND transporter periplasmic adaptor subunit [Parvibaculaceae bacterium]|nr:efflux RND transporter periplasmic adaptor subunit [Parvibaculaceae bacterium]
MGILDRFFKRDNESGFSGSIFAGKEEGEHLGRFQLVMVVVVLVGAVMVASLMGGARQALERSDVKELAPLVTTIDVQPGTHRIFVEGSGTVQTSADVNIVPQVSGRIEWMNPDMRSGGRFAAGEVVFRVEPVDYKLAVQNQQANVASAQTEWELERAEGKAAAAEWKQINPNEAIPALVARKPHVRQALASLQSAKASLANAKLDLARTNFSFPFAGRVRTATVEVGQFVSAGQSYGTAYSLEGLEIEVPLADKDLRWFDPEGNTKAVVSTTYLGRTYELPAHVARTGAELNEQTRFSTVIVRLDQPDTGSAKDQRSYLVPGVFVNVRFFGPEVENLYAVPVEAFQENNLLWSVKDGRLKSVQPQVFQFGTEENLVKGLSPEMRVVSRAVSGAVDGMSVRVFDGDVIGVRPDVTSGTGAAQ